MFGNEAGAYTDAKGKRVGRFEAAGNGTLFLDEISELPYHLQSKLLRVLQERTFERLGSVKPLQFSARLIAASNRNLEEEVREGRFREDLFHRLNLAALRVPTLREREGDIRLLAGHFLRQANREIGKNITGIEKDVIKRLEAHDWPGNVRELEHCIKRSVLAARSSTITIHDLEIADADAADATAGSDLRQALRVHAAAIVSEPDKFGGAGSIYQHLVDLAGCELIEAALRATDGNQVAASKLLGINRATLRKRLAERNRES